MKLSRRSFLFGGTAILGSTILGVQKISTWNLTRVNHQFIAPELPMEFHQYRIGFLSDVHLGVYVTEEWARHALTMLESADLDLLIIGGDHINLPPSLPSGRPASPGRSTRNSQRERYYGELAMNRFISLLQPAAFRDGIVAIAGNHDNWNAAPLVKPLFERAGVNYLVNEVRTIKRGSAALEIVGVDDYWTGVPRLPVSGQAGANPARILVAHNPDYLSTVLEDSDYHFTLGLAGHTHGGQICLPGSLPLITRVRDTRFVHGVIRELRAPVLVSSGVGLVEIPCRINCPPEVHTITLETA